MCQNHVFEESGCMKIFIPRRRYGLMRACLLLPPLCVLASVLACSGPKPEPQAGAVVETNADPNLITMQNPGQFQLTAPELHKVSDEIRVTGVISPRREQISPHPVAGRRSGGGHEGQTG